MNAEEVKAAIRKIEDLNDEIGEFIDSASNIPKGTHAQLALHISVIRFHSSLLANLYHNTRAMHGNKWESNKHSEQ